MPFFRQKHLVDKRLQHRKIVHVIDNLVYQCMS